MKESYLNEIKTEEQSLLVRGYWFGVACVASVSVRLSVCSMHFSLFWPRENWGGRKKALFCARPNFRAAKKQKMPRTCGKPCGNACYAG